MKRYSGTFVRCAFLLVASSLVLVVPALAGPPLICHPIHIGAAASLPWPSDGGSVVGRQDYDVNRLVADTLSLLNPRTDVLVRMETLRRATIYAQRNPFIAKELLLRLHARTIANPKDALAAFDFGYLVECYKQAQFARSEGFAAWRNSEWSNPAANLDGYSFVKSAIRMRGEDAEMEFAAALISSMGSRKDCQEHIERAAAGAKGNALLSENLSSRFGEQTVAQALTAHEDK
jgi:hypothetical protein